MLDALEELDVVAGLQRDERLLPRRTLTRETADTLDLAAHDERADLGDVDLEQLLDSAADVDLVRVASDLEHDLLRVRLALGRGLRSATGLAKTCALLREERTLDDSLRTTHWPWLPCPRAPASLALLPPGSG